MPAMNNDLPKFVTILTIVLSATVWQQSADGAGWGSVKGRFVLDGTPPEMAALDASKEPFCVQHHPLDQSVLVGDDGGLANAVIFIKLGRRDKIEVHPDYEATARDSIVLDNHGCTFVPHITLARAGQTLVVKNSDPVGHNTNLKLRANGNVNPTIAAGAQFEKSLTKGEALPLPVDCNIHTFMHGYILVQDHPYMAASAEDGTFEIKNVPAGKHEFQFWHEASGYLQSLKYQGGALNRQGRTDLTTVDGQTLDLGEIKVPASLLQ
jgi:hypothetical protein